MEFGSPFAEATATCRNRAADYFVFIKFGICMKRNNGNFIVNFMRIGTEMNSAGQAD